MSNIIGIPTTRVSDQFVRTRLLQQVQDDQKDLLRLQIQLSTGRKFERPGEDPVAAGRVMSLQSLLERKTQVRANLTTNQSFLTSTDTALSKISNLVAEARGAAIGAIGATASEQQRAAVAIEVAETIRQLVDAGNQNFRGRYLFAGSTTAARPFQMVGDNTVEYLGNDKTLLSYSDIDLLFETNASGSYVFGALSEPVRGSADLDPAVTHGTRLADLRGGEGISAGSLAVSDGVTISIIDISRAATLGDVAELLRANPPEGRTLDVEITPKGLRIQLNQDMPGNLVIREVGRGTTAGELGILTPGGAGLGPVVGGDLAPILRTTTRLDDLLGARAQATEHGSGTDFDWVSGIQIANGGHSYTIRFDEAETVEDLLNAINGSGAGVVAEINSSRTGIDIRSRLSGADFSIGENGGTTATELGLRTFNRQTRLADLNHGFGVAGAGAAAAGTAAFRISRRDGVEIEIDLAGCQTIGDCLDAINSHALNADGMLRASLSAYGNGIELVDQSAGDAVLEVSRIGTSTAAIDLGLIPDGADSASAQTHDSAASSLVGTDCNPAETKSLFTALLRLQRALQDNDLAQIQRSIELLDASVLQMNFSRAELGVRQQGLDVLGQRLDAEELDLREVLSSKYDADLAEVISNLTARQIALQASMKATAQTFQMTLLDYL